MPYIMRNNGMDMANYFHMYFLLKDDHVGKHAKINRRLLPLNCASFLIIPQKIQR